MAKSTIRHLLLSVPALLFCLSTTPQALAQDTHASIQQKFFGKWKLDLTKSKIAHPGDDRSIQWRSYAPDGDRVKVAWGNDKGEAGSYSAKCDGTIEALSSGNIRCRPAGPAKIDGEQLDTSDALHRYYRRMLSSHEKIMSIVWYTDEKRRHPMDRFVYTKD